MNTFFLSYDLRNNRDYKSFYDELSSFNAVKMLDSCWYLNRRNTDAATLRDHFRQFLDSGDRLLVSRADGWATYNAADSPKEIF